jgi:hypothetical protein
MLPEIVPAGKENIKEKPRELEEDLLNLIAEVIVEIILSETKK